MALWTALPRFRGESSESHVGLSRRAQHGSLVHREPASARQSGAMTAFTSHAKRIQRVPLGCHEIGCACSRRSTCARPGFG
jgi:hypothetical protein